MDELGTGLFQVDSVQTQDTYASAGTLIASALENSGYFAQQMVLEQFLEVITALAALIYLGAFVGAIVTVALSGNYKSAVWFLIGPVIFYFMTLTTIEANGTNWSFGVYKDDQKLVEAVNKTESSEKAKVSWFFHRYNSLVSSVVQNTIKVVTNQSVKRQLLFMTRSRIMERIFTAKVDNQALVNLVAYGVSGQCAEHMDAGRTIALANRYGKEVLPGMKNPVRTQASIYFKAITKHNDIDKADVDFNSDKNTIIYLSQMIERFRKGPEDKTNLINALCIEPGEDKLGPNYFLYPEGKTTNVNEQSLSNVLTNNGSSCAQVWCWTALGFAEEASANTYEALQELIDPKLVKTYIDDPERSPIYDNIYEEILAHIAIKLQKPVEFETHVASDASESETQVANEDPDNRGKKGDANTARIGPGKIVDIDSRQEDLSIIPVITAGILLRNTLRDDPRSRMMTQFAKGVGIYNKPYNIGKNSSSNQISDIARIGNQHSMAQGFQYEVFYLGSTLPYIQGVMLFALAMLFPFFCILLVLPGKAHAFLSWCALWTWLKFWDVGWAFVMVADDMIWNMMPHASWFSIHRDANHGPLTILESAFQYDFSYSLANYYMLLGAMLFFVPVVSGQVILGAKQAVGGVLLQSMKGLAEGYGGTAADYVAVGNTQQANYMREMSQLGEVHENAIVNQTPANEDLAEMQKGEAESAKKAKNEHSLGKGIAIFGAVMLGVVAVAGIAFFGAVLLGAVALSAAGAITAATAIGAGAKISSNVQNQGQVTMQNSIKMQRASHARRAQYNSLNTVAWLQKTNFNHSAWNGTRLRQAWSRRGQHWTVVDAQMNVPGAIAKLKAEREGMDSYATGSYYGAMTTNVISSVETAVEFAAKKNKPL